MEVIYHGQKENTRVINVSHHSPLSYSFLCLRSHFKLVWFILPVKQTSAWHVQCDLHIILLQQCLRKQLRSHSWSVDYSELQTNLSFFCP